MEVQLLNRRLSRPRAALVVAVAGALAAVVAVSPSFAESFLTSQKASHLYLTNRKANGIYLKQKAAGNLFVKKADAPLTPIVAIAAGTVPFEATATTAGYIPSAFTSFATKGNAPAVVTFSGQATCVAEKPTVELACPIQILVDGQTTGKVNFAPATVPSPKTAALIHTVTQTTVLGKGGHTVAVQYAGAAKVSFALRVGTSPSRRIRKQPKRLRPKRRKPARRASRQRPDRAEEDSARSGRFRPHLPRAWRYVGGVKDWPRTRRAR
jgi:hypothetical protein